MRKVLLLSPCDMEETQRAEQGLTPLPFRAYTHNLASSCLGALLSSSGATGEEVMNRNPKSGDLPDRHCDERVRKHYDGKDLGDDLAQ